MQKNSFTYEELITCGKGDLFGEGNAKLPLPPMLMFDRITEIDNNSGEFKKGFIKAELDIKENLWFFDDNNRPRHASCANRATCSLRKSIFSSLEASKWSPRGFRGALGGLLGPTWALLGALLGARLGALGRLLGDLGRSCGALGGLLDGSERPLGGSWTAHGARRSILELPRVDFGPSGIRFWAIWGSILVDRGSILADFGSTWLAGPRSNPSGTPGLPV